MVHDDVVVRLEVFEQAVRAAVQVVASHYLVAWPQHARYDVQSAHACRYGEDPLAAYDLC